MFLRNRSRWRYIGAPRGWTPAALGSDLALWLDAADAGTITLNGSTVSQWSDKSGNARHATQGTAANQPTYTASGLNGKPVLTFDGARWFNAITASLPNFSAMMVETATQNSSIVYYPIGFSGLATGLSVGGTFNSQRFSFFDGTTALVTPQSSVLNAPTILFGGSDNAGRQISINGNAPTTDTTTQSVSQITIGRRGDAQWPFFGTIAEIVLTNNLLSTANRQRLEGYLAWKWSGYL